MKNKKRIDKIVRQMNRKQIDYKKENWKSKCDACGNIQEYTEEFKCQKCNCNGRSLIKYLKETK